jgi:activator of HSP90 ATPase
VNEVDQITRRQIGLVLGGLAAVSTRGQTQKHGTTIHQEVDFKAPAARIYEILLDAKQFSACTKDSAQIQPQAGGAFKLFGGRIEGRNIELLPNQRIVQAWRPAYWPAGVYSIVKFELVPREAGTRVVLDHAAFTEDQWEGLSSGWQEHYWGPLHKYLNA